VIAACPPFFDFSRTKTFSLAREAYNAADKPAGPEPIIITS